MGPHNHVKYDCISAEFCAKLENDLITERVLWINEILLDMIKHIDADAKYMPFCRDIFKYIFLKMFEF